jgi:hypothetical protein
MPNADELNRAIRSLNRLLAAEQESLIPHLGESYPFVSWASADEALVLEGAVREQLEHIEWMTEAILDARGAPAPRRPSMSLASVHYCDVQSLVPRILEDKRRIIRTYEAAAPAIVTLPAAADVARRCLERHRHHLAQLEETFAAANT